MMLITAACVIHPSIFHHWLKIKPDNQQSSSLQYKTVQYSMGGEGIELRHTCQHIARSGSDCVIYSRRGDLSELDWKIFRPV